MRTILLTCCLCIFCWGSDITAEEPVKDNYVVSGAGYKKPLLDIISMYEKKPRTKVYPVFGNMKMITTYIKKSDKVSVIIGDKTFIEKSAITVLKTKKLGNGKLVLVYNSKFTLNSPDDLKKTAIKRIGMPDPKKAIYGNAAKQAIEYYKLGADIKNKILILKTIPQISAYLISGEIDAGFINMTDYINIKKNKLKMLPIDQKAYSEINIQAGLINAEGKDLYQFLFTEEAINIFKKYGLKQFTGKYNGNLTD